MFLLRRCTFSDRPSIALHVAEGFTAYCALPTVILPGFHLWSDFSFLVLFIPGTHLGAPKALRPRCLAVYGAPDLALTVGDFTLFRRLRFQCVAVVLSRVALFGSAPVDRRGASLCRGRLLSLAHLCFRGRFLTVSISRFSSG